MGKFLRFSTRISKLRITRMVRMTSMCRPWERRHLAGFSTAWLRRIKEPVRPRFPGKDIESGKKSPFNYDNEFYIDFGIICFLFCLYIFKSLKQNESGSCILACGLLLSIQLTHSAAFPGVGRDPETVQGSIQAVRHRVKRSPLEVLMD